MSAFCGAWHEQRASRSFLRGCLGGFQDPSLVVLIALFSFCKFTVIKSFRELWVCLGVVSVVGDFFPCS